MTMGMHHLLVYLPCDIIFANFSNFRSDSLGGLGFAGDEDFGLAAGAGWARGPPVWAIRVFGPAQGGADKAL